MTPKLRGNVHAKDLFVILSISPFFPYPKNFCKFYSKILARDVLSIKSKTLWGKLPYQLMPEENNDDDLLWTSAASNKIIISKGHGQ